MTVAVAVDPPNVAIVWPHVKHWIKKAYQRCDLGRFDETEPKVLSGRYVLWVIWNEPTIEGAGLTFIYHTEAAKVCQIIVYGGEGYRFEMLEAIENYARAEGCDCVRFLGRKGWARVMKNYTQTKVILERKLK